MEEKGSSSSVRLSSLGRARPSVAGLLKKLGGGNPDSPAKWIVLIVDTGEYWSEEREWGSVSRRGSLDEDLEGLVRSSSSNDSLLFGEEVLGREPRPPRPTVRTMAGSSAWEESADESVEKREAWLSGFEMVRSRAPAPPRPTNRTFSCFDDWSFEVEVDGLEVSRRICGVLCTTPLRNLVEVTEDLEPPGLNFATAE